MMAGAHITKKKLDKKKRREKRTRKYGKMHINNKAGKGFLGLTGKMNGEKRT